MVKDATGQALGYFDFEDEPGVGAVLARQAVNRRPTWTPLRLRSK